MYCRKKFILFILSLLFATTMNSQESYVVDLIDSIADSEHYIGEQIENPTPRWEDAVRAKLNAAALDADHYHFNTGISVYDLTAGMVLFGYNQQKMMRPASTEKLLTAITALDLLGADHLYSTNVYACGDIVTQEDGSKILNGDIYVVGDFDPKLELTDIHLMAGAIAENGIHGITGKVFADISMKDTLCLGNGWCWDDSQPYLTPLSLTGSSYECKNVKINRYNPALDFVSVLAKELNKKGITVSNGYGIRTLPRGGSVMLITKICHSIAEVLPKMMKKSDNLYAESMFYQLAADRKKNISWKDCAAEVEKVIEKSGASTSYVEIADGSGISLYNYVTPSTQVSMLRYAYNNKLIFSALYPSLPIAGIDGTLSSRMGNGKAYKNVHAKTGTVSGVSCLAGYVTASNGHILAFSIMNNGVRKAAEGKAFQDRICRILTE